MATHAGADITVRSRVRLISFAPAPFAGVPSNSPGETVTD